MSGTKAGGLKTAATNMSREPDFYRRIGRKGGQNGHTGGFASDKVGADGLTGHQRSRVAGAKGGHISRRGPAKCKKCKYYAASEEVCCNSDSEHCADFTDPDDSCDKWEENHETT